MFVLSCEGQQFFRINKISATQRNIVINITHRKTSSKKKYNEVFKQTKAF